MAELENKEWLDQLRKVNWDWDFKKCYGSIDPNSGISNFLKYKLGLLVDNSHPLKYTKVYGNKYIGRHGDCDKEAYPMYKFLEWQNNFEDSIRGETMNSFTTTFHQAIMLSSNKDDVYKEIGINENQYLNKQYEILLKDNNYKIFSCIKDNLKEFEEFAKLTHTIGNFTVLPNWMNTGRGGSFTVLDYWDLTLKNLYEFLFPLGAWETFVNKYFLHSFLDKNLKPMEFWDNHFTGSVKITKADQLAQFLFRVNRSIEERGKYLKGKLDDKETSKLPKSAEELWNKENRLEN